jgi:hypothetical protein
MVHWNDQPRIVERSMGMKGILFFLFALTEKEANTTWGHIVRSSNRSIAKARSLLGYEPPYRWLEALRESITWLFANE